jgi:hypothetical protein
VAQCAIEWTQKFVLLLIFLVSQEKAIRITSKESKIIEEILQSRAEFGCWRARIITFESRSRINRSKGKVVANEIANRAVKASPTLGEHEGLIWEII